MTLLQLKRQLATVHRQLAPALRPLTPRGDLTSPVLGSRWGWAAGLASLLLLPRWKRALLVGRCGSVLSACLLLPADRPARLQFSPMPAVWRVRPCCALPYDRMAGLGVWWSPLPCCFISVNSAASTSAVFV